MLTIQPNYSGNYSVNRASKPAFKGFDKESIEDDKNFFARQRDELDEILADDYVPETIKKPFKFFRMIANAAISGLAVFGSALAVAGFFKKTGSKVVSNEALKNTVNKAKPLGDKAVKGLKFVYRKANEMFGLFKETKIGQKAGEVYKKFAQTTFGQKVINTTKKYSKRLGQFIKKAIAPVKNTTYDKATKATATILGTGSGFAGGYQEYIKSSPVETIEEEG